MICPEFLWTAVWKYTTARVRIPIPAEVARLLGSDSVCSYSSYAVFRNLEAGAVCSYRSASFYGQLQRRAEYSRDCPWSVLESCDLENKDENAAAELKIMRRGSKRMTDIIKAFLTGGLICSLVQILLDRTKC